MNIIGRRDFIKATLGAGVAMAVPAWAAESRGRVAGANDAIRVAVVGMRSKGRSLANQIKQIPGVRLVAFCDVDSQILEERVAQFAAEEIKVTPYRDYRKLLENPEIDAVVISTPNHWHALMAIWACQAGKDVYVEKPVSHSIWEGRKIVEAARKYNRIVQAGTQFRSEEGVREAIEYMRSGEVGKMLWVKAVCFKRRKSIGNPAVLTEVPATVDYDLWAGPTPMEPVRREQFHYDWHWFWTTGNGEIGNTGPHMIDEGRWALGDVGLPRRVLSVGGRFALGDNAETPNTQVTFYDYDVPLISEVRGLPMNTEVEAMDHYHGLREGIVIKCEGGYFAGHGKGYLYDNNNQRLRRFEGVGGEDHLPNFFAAMRSRRVEDLNADIEKGHVSSALCHLGNVSYQLGSEVGQNQVAQAIVRELESEPQACESFVRLLSHLEANGVDPAATPLTLGAHLEVDVENERFVDNERANELVRPQYREPYVVPEQV